MNLSQLPNDLLIAIVSVLSPNDASFMLCISKSIRLAINDNDLWKLMCILHWKHKQRHPYTKLLDDGGRSKVTNHRHMEDERTTHASPFLGLLAGVIIIILIIIIIIIIIILFFFFWFFFFVPIIVD
jgi:hypothetical protein